jgi:hypothetical protein
MQPLLRLYSILNDHSHSHGQYCIQRVRGERIPWSTSTNLLSMALIPRDILNLSMVYDSQCVPVDIEATSPLGEPVASAEHARSLGRLPNDVEEQKASLAPSGNRVENIIPLQIEQRQAGVRYVDSSKSN